MPTPKKTSKSASKTRIAPAVRTVEKVVKPVVKFVAKHPPVAAFTAGVLTGGFGLAVLGALLATKRGQEALIQEARETASVAVFFVQDKAKKVGKSLKTRFTPAAANDNNAKASAPKAKTSRAKAPKGPKPPTA